MPSISIGLVDKTSKSYSKAPRLKNHGALRSWAARIPNGLAVDGKFGKYFDFTKLHGKPAGQTLSTIQKAMRSKAPSTQVSASSFSEQINGTSVDQLLRYLSMWGSANPDGVWQVQRVSTPSLAVLTGSIVPSQTIRGTTQTPSGVQKHKTGSFGQPSTKTSQPTKISQPTKSSLQAKGSVVPVAR